MTPDDPQTHTQQVFQLFLLLDTAGFRDKESFKKVSAVHYVQLP